MQKGALNADLKKSATLDDDFGKDFFNSWKSAKMGNDSIDFDMETVPKNIKPSFKFDELDNFELSGNFDKLRSFKLDVPDLDFPDSSKKNEKSSKEFDKGIKELKGDKFSFDFDFNSFDLDSKSTEDERPCNFSDKNVPENSSNNEKKHQSADQLSDSAHKTQLSIGDRDNIPENNKKKNYLTMAQREHSQGNYLTNENSDNNQYFCLPSSGDGSAEVVLPEIQTASTPLDVDKPREIMNKQGSIQPISSSPSMSSSPVDSYNSGCWTKAGENELPNPGIVLKNQSQGPPTGISGSLTGSIQIRKDANNYTGPKKSIEGVKNIDEKQNQCQKLKLPPEKPNSRENLILPPLKREITFGGSAKMRGLMSAGLQSKAISKLEDNIAQQFPALISKPFNSTLEARTKTTHASSTTNESSFQLKTLSASHQTLMSAKNVATTRLQKPISDATIDPKASSSGNKTSSVKENVTAKHVSSNKLGSQFISTSKDAALGDSNHPGVLAAITETIGVNKSKPNSAKPSDAKSVRILEKRMECPVNVASKTTNLASIEKKSSLSASLKRKIDEQSVADLGISSPLECVKESNASQRISFESSPNTRRKMVPDIKITETCRDLNPVANSLNVVPEIENLLAGVSSFFMTDDNLRKAENLTKELDNICNIVRKKHEEAKDLQVRSIINNNALLLLNYTMLEEKIQALQKFSSSLLIKEI